MGVSACDFFAVPSKVQWKGRVSCQLIKKAQRDNKDPWLCLLDYRNTPTTGMQTSPAQRLMSRRTKTLVPISSNIIIPRSSRRSSKSNTAKTPDGQKLSRQERKGATRPGNRSRGATFPVTTRKAMESGNLRRETLGQIIYG